MLGTTHPKRLALLKSSCSWEYLGYNNYPDLDILRKLTFSMETLHPTPIADNGHNNLIRVIEVFIGLSFVKQLYHAATNQHHGKYWIGINDYEKVHMKYIHL